VLFVGDAAAAADPMTGEGIGQALLTGRLAAQAAIDQQSLLGVSYRRAVRRHLVADHRLARWCGQLLGSVKGAETTLRLVDRNDWTRRNFARWMFEDYPRAVLATPRRWHRGMLTPPGAYHAGAPDPPPEDPTEPSAVAPPLTTQRGRVGAPVND
jgi:flavin-dependent dehydrogenase